MADAAVHGDLKGRLADEFTAGVGPMDGADSAGRAGGDEFPAVRGLEQRLPLAARRCRSVIHSSSIGVSCWG
ncbi:hypothetical protein [Nocardia sp. NBC_01009]|uniref:hypothetical protein n=1 Tax=Nocardia sp. NBC_01009 TaxID=2975996 RepID=UPI00386DFD06|nr:hypothetical protein OHA42_14600 [Nocardia sp. NBC_01009]